MRTTTSFAVIVMLASVALLAVTSPATAQWSIGIAGYSIGSEETQHYRISLESPDVRHFLRVGGFPFTDDTVEGHLRLQITGVHFYHKQPFNGVELGTSVILEPHSWTVFGDQVQLREGVGAGAYSVPGDWIFGGVVACALGVKIGRGFSCEVGVNWPLEFYTHDQPLLFELGIRKEVE